MNDGGPAFSCPTGDPTLEPTHGMSLRDYFAAAAATGVARYSFSEQDHSVHAERAYKVADAMIKEREKAQP